MGKWGRTIHVAGAPVVPIYAKRSGPPGFQKEAGKRFSNGVSPCSVVAGWVCQREPLI